MTPRPYGIDENRSVVYTGMGRCKVDYNERTSITSSKVYRIQAKPYQKGKRKIFSFVDISLCKESRYH
jgi:hypothetical protein